LSLGQIQSLNGADEAAACAGLMVASEPWITLRLPYAGALAALTDPAREVHVIRDAAGVAGFIVLDMRGLLAGYIQILCVRPDCRGHGVGSTLVRWAEDRIFRDSPNVFIWVSSFNAGARSLYERLGFEPAGVLRDFIVPGHDEILLRKTRGAWADFRRLPTRSASD
jgi:ribosomal protein S18 acetylase RimI-like enzyme